MLKFFPKIFGLTFSFFLASCTISNQEENQGKSIRPGIYRTKYMVELSSDSLQKKDTIDFVESIHVESEKKLNIYVSVLDSTIHKLLNCEYSVYPDTILNVKYESIKYPAWPDSIDEYRPIPIGTIDKRMRFSIYDLNESGFTLDRPRGKFLGITILSLSRFNYSRISDASGEL